MLNLVSNGVDKAGSARKARDMRRAEVKLADASSCAALDDIYNDADGTPAVELAQEIIGNYKQRVQNVRLDFLEQITRDSLAFLTGQKSSAERQHTMDEIMVESMQSIVDEVFSALDPFIAEFNRAVACTQLTVSLTSPAVVKEILSYDSMRRPIHTISSYRARISTCSYSIVIRGQYDRVDFFLLPVEQVMALSKIEAEHTPIMSFTGLSNGYTVAWQVEGKPLTEDRLERFCLHLFDYLVEQTREELLTKQSS